MTPADIRTIRQQLGLTQAQFAARFPVARRTLEDWERGVAKPPPYIERAIRDFERELLLHGSE